MNALLVFFLVYAFLRSLSNGVDRLYETHFLLALSITAIVVGLVVAWHMRHVRIHRRLFTLLMCLSVFVVTAGLSFVVNAFGAGSIVDQYAAWYEIFRYVYLIMFAMLLSSVYRHPTFCLNVHRVYLLLLFLISAVGLGQYLTGNAVLVTQYDKFERVAGLSSHPVPFSLEIVLTFCVCELSRRTMRLPIRHYHIVVYMLFLVALLLSASRTGVALLGVTIGIFLLAQRPSLLPAFAAAFAVVILISPFGELFSELRTVPEYFERRLYGVGLAHRGDLSPLAHSSLVLSIYTCIGTTLDWIWSRSSDVIQPVFPRERDVFGSIRLGIPKSEVF